MIRNMRRGALPLVIALVSTAGTAAISASVLLERDGLAEAPELAAVAIGRETSPPGAGSFETQVDRCAAGAWWRVCFSGPRSPDLPRSAPGLDVLLIDRIHAARQSIDLAIFDIDLPAVADALALAQRRGVVVRLVVDDSALADGDPSAVRTLAILREAAIPIRADGSSGLMHHKFAVFDRTEVAVGSWNATSGDAYRLNNALALLRDPSIAAAFSAEFTQMAERGQFGRAKRAGALPRASAPQGTRVEIRMGPVDRPVSAIAGLIRGAASEVRFMAYTFTNREVADALLAAAARGVAVSGVVEEREARRSESVFGLLRGRGLDVRVDGNPWAMHHKALIVDRRIVAFGSPNFSAQANDTNDESLVIIEDEAFAAAWLLEAGRVAAIARP